MTPTEAFARLQKDGAFVEIVDYCHVNWYWHQLSNGYRIMARTNLDSVSGPTLYHAFHEKV